ncbi:MAG: DUF3050 domain-containing protein [Gemmataceae bacterium]|nr:DUF3050 domain-containing protein [Gemmataceae bacterium]
MDWLEDSQLRNLRGQLIDHLLYRRLTNPQAIRVFMEHHVWCVWDFQSLLKSLQTRLTCVTLPWIPTADPLARRLINEIVMGEESDEDGQGGYASHLEIYLQAMSKCGADAGAFLDFLRELQQGSLWKTALENSRAPQGVKAFVEQTLETALEGGVHEVAAAFTIGREDLIPGMFMKILEHTQEEYGVDISLLLYYLNRHVAVDGECHGPQALRLLASLCQNDARKKSQALGAAIRCLKSRLALWDEIAGKMD